jgi:nitrite reductase (NO-forming)
MITRREALIGTTMAAALAVSARKGAEAAVSEAEIDDLEHVRVDLVDPPLAHVHEQATSAAPRVIEYAMEIVEKEIEIDADGTKMWAMTYNGSVPGPLMVVHEGDYVQLTLTNPASNEMPHNIDFHASTGALGGGELTLIYPGEQTTLRFKATRAGVFVYHCAPPGMIPWHVVSGMNGAIMVLPRKGLTDPAGNPLRYDRLFYIGESDFYVPRDETGAFRRYETLGESFDDTMNVMRRLIPSHVVFEGKAGSLTGDKAMTAKVGETVLLVHSQANRDTRPHLIGGHGDFVWEHGKFGNAPQVDFETWFIRGGSAGAALYTFRQPGIYAYVNHNLIEAAELGATAHFKVEGEWNNELMKQVMAPTPIPAQ